MPYKLIEAGGLAADPDDTAQAIRAIAAMAGNSPEPGSGPVRVLGFDDPGSSWHRYTNMVIEPGFFCLSFIPLLREI
jgi:hypothetical protein